MRRPLNPCPLCGSPSMPFELNVGASTIGYRRCKVCGFIGTEPVYRLSPAEEKARYLLHANIKTNLGYMDFLRAFIDKALRPFKLPGATVLDFGSGPSPLLAELAIDQGYLCDLYDPFFAPTRAWKKERYDAIILHETAEHLSDPGKVFSLLTERLVAGGIIAIRTRFLPEATNDFRSWWYRMDRTHVSFFSTACLEKFFETRGFRIILLEKPDMFVAEDARCEDIS